MTKVIRKQTKTKHFALNRGRKGKELIYCCSWTRNMTTGFNLVHSQMQNIVNDGEDEKMFSWNVSFSLFVWPPRGSPLELSN